MDENNLVSQTDDPLAVVEINPNVSVAEQEKMLPQSQVNKIVQHEKTKAAQAARREAEEIYKRELESLQNPAQRNTSQSADTDSKSNAADVTYQDFRHRFISEIQAAQQQKEEAKFKEEMEKVVDTYYNKMSEGKNSYDDFEEVTKVFNPAAFPALSALASKLDNTADVIYELANNPSKLVTLDTLVGKSPQHAEAELLKLSKSISTNKKAQSGATSNQVAAPLERLQPSKVTGSNGKLSIRDLRAQPWLRG